MKKRTRFVDAIVGAPQIVVAVCALLTLFGIWALLHMPRQEFPDFTLRQGLVVGIFPGASSEQVEEQLTRHVEDYLFSYQEICKSKTVSYSKDGQMIIMIELNDNVKNPDVFWSRLRHGLAELKQQLPPQVVALIANSDFGNTSAVLLAMVADSGSNTDMDTWLKAIESEIRTIPAVSRMKRSGEQKDEIRVYIDKEKLAWYGINPVTILSALQAETMTAGAGSVTSGNLDMPIHVPASVKSQEDIAQQIILTTPQGTVVRVRDVARVVRDMEKPSSFVRNAGSQAAVLSIEMQPGNNIVEFGADVTKAIERAKKRLPEQVRLVRLSDAPAFVNASVGSFLKEFGIAIITVILVTMLLLPLRVAAVAAVTIPVGVCISLGILMVMGQSLNTVSLAALILVLGMIVDNAIVIVDDYVDRLDKGEDLLSAARNSVSELFVPVFTATLAIIMTFVPISLMTTGTVRDFTGPMPPTIAVALIVSLILSVSLIPIMNVRFIRHGLRKPHMSDDENANDRSFLGLTQQYYNRLLAWAFKHPKTVITLSGVAFAAALIGAAIMPRRSFPSIERNQFAVEIYLPTGTALEETDRVCGTLEKALLADARVKDVTAFVGTSSPRFHAVYAPQFPSPNYGQLVVNTTTSEATVAMLDEYNTRFHDAFPNAHIRWKQLEMQKNAAPIEVRISGDSIPQLKKACEEISQLFDTMPGVTWVRNDYQEPLAGISILPDWQRANEQGISRSLIAASMAVATGGLKVGDIREGDRSVGIRLLSNNADHDSIALLGSQTVVASGQSVVPLRSVAALAPDYTEGQIVHRNGVRALSVIADINKHTLASAVLGAREKDIQRIAGHYGVSISYGGEKETEMEVYVPLAQALLVTITIIFLILLIQFKRTRLALLVMLTMPLGFPGMVLGLTIFGYPFGTTAFIGFSSLMGMVVRNGIIYVNYAQQLIARGMDPKEAAMAAARRRMRPIILTSAAAAFGVIPMILSRSTLWGPLGSVICVGLVVSTVLTLLLLPIAYWLLVRRHTHEGVIHTGHVHVPASVTLLILAGLLLAPQSISAQSTKQLSREECRRIAEENSPEIQNAQYDKKAAQEVRKAAFTKWFPSVNASIQGVLFQDPLIQYNSPGGNLPVYNGDPSTLGSASQFAYMPPSSLSLLDTLGVISATAVQPLFAGGRIRNGNRLAKLGADVADVKHTMTRRDVFAQIDSKYRTAASLSSKEKTLREYAGLLDRLKRDVDNALAAGLATRNDQLKVQIKQQEVAAQIEQLKSGKRLAVRDLCLTIGLKDNGAVDICDTVARPTENDIPTSVNNDALTGRPEMTLLRKSVDAEKLQTRMARGEAMPSVSVGFMELHVVMPQMEPIANRAVFGTVSIPLSSWWETSHTIAEHRYREQRAITTRDQMENAMALQIEKEQCDLADASRSVNLADSSIAQAEENLRDCQGRYRNGLATVSEALEAQALLQEMRAKQIDAWVSFWNHRTALLNAAGVKQE